jgi:nucleotide-sensitive chloride channel 1A
LLISVDRKTKSDIRFSYSVTHPHGDCGDEDSEEGMQDMTEMRFVPDDKGMLDAMFHAMSECQSLHPDSQDSFSEGLYLFVNVPLTVSII